MPWRSRAPALFLLSAGLFLIGTAPALAAETSNSDIVIIREGDVVHDDLYAGAMTVVIIGEVDGDLVAFAAEGIRIEGTVTGSVTAVAPSVSVSGSVGGSVRAAAREVSVTGSVSGDLVTTAVKVTMGADSVIGGDALVWALQLSAGGFIGHDLTGTQRTLEMSGVVRGNVEVAVGRLDVVDDLRVEGDLGYRSDREAEGLELASVGGTVVHKATLPPNLRVRALVLFARLMSIIFLTIAAVTTVWGWPQRSQAAADRVVVKPWKNWLYGAAVFASPLLVIAASGVVVGLAPPAAGLPFLGLAVPLTLALLGLLLVVSMAAGVPVAARVGKRLLARRGSFGAVLGGSIILGLAWMLPLVGWLVPLIALPLGLGSWILSRGDRGLAQSSG
ncbi:MAG: hypothetical protein WD269_07785 [Acidimicrobiia bacterium]